MDQLVLTPCASEPELADPAITGHFAAEMATLTGVDHVPPFCGYIARVDGVPVGFGGFQGQPDAAGVAEIGYLTFPAHEGRGVATGVARALATIAFTNGVTLLLAHTMPESGASARVLEKAGFTRNGTDMDKDIGLAWRWELAP